jgi:hypothetical protein
MNPSSDQSPAARKQTPRVPSNFLYARLVPISIGILVVVLIVIIVVVLASLFGLVPAY